MYINPRLNGGSIYIYTYLQYIHIHIPGSPAAQEFGLKSLSLLIRLIPEISPEIKKNAWSGSAHFSPQRTTTYINDKKK